MSTKTNKKGRYFFLIFISSLSLLIFYSNSLVYPPSYFFISIFGWFPINYGSLVYINVLSPFFVGFFSWSIVIYYFGTINFRRFKRAIKSMFLFYPFWLGIIIFVGSLGPSSYYNIWILAHLMMRVWSIGGSLLMVIMVINFILYRFNKPIIRNALNRDSLTLDKKFVPRSKIIRVIDFFEKRQIYILILIILTIGFSFSISNFLMPVSYHLIAFVFLFFTLFILNFLFIVNYLFSINQDYHKIIKRKEQEFYLGEFEDLLVKLNDLIEQGNKDFSSESFEIAINKWSEALEIYKQVVKFSKDKKKIKKNIQILKLNILDAHKGAALVHLKNGQEAYKTLDVKNAKLEWELLVEDLEIILKLTKFKKPKLNRKEIKLKIDEVQKNLKRLEIELLISEADEKLKSTQLMQDKETTKTISLTNEIILMYSNAKKKVDKSKEYSDYSEKIQNRILNVRVLQEKLQEKLDKLMGVTPIEKRVSYDIEELTEFEIASVIKDEIIKQIISIIREYDFIGGQIRFKLGLVNNTNYPLTNFRITFDIPKSLKWILHEPDYERKGDSILIAKVGAKEKKAISLYLEPLNCMESHINATVSFFDAKDRPHAIPMKPKMVTISCPIFFTETDANLARVKSLRRNLTHRDKKVFPIIKPENASSIFSSILSVLEQFDIKLISKEFFEENNFGEAWFFGITKVKKERLVMYVLLDGERKTLEFEVSGNNEEQITAFLAEIGDRIRQKLIEKNIIASEEGFYDMRIAILSCLCPYCYTLMASESVERFCNGETIICENCNVNIKID